MTDDDDNDLRRRSRRYRASIRRRLPRKRTIPTKRLTRSAMSAGWLEAGGDTPYERPRTRGDCREGIRPCPFVACKYHLYLDINPETGSITLNFPGFEPDELEHTCALDIAELGGITLEEVGNVLNITRERVRQIEVRAVVAKLRGPALAAELDEVIVQDGLSPLAEAQTMEVGILPSEVGYVPLG